MNLKNALAKRPLHIDVNRTSYDRWKKYAPNYPFLAFLLTTQTKVYTGDSWDVAQFRGLLKRTTSGDIINDTATIVFEPTFADDAELFIGMMTTQFEWSDFFPGYGNNGKKVSIEVIVPALLGAEELHRWRNAEEKEVGEKAIAIMKLTNLLSMLETLGGGMPGGVVGGDIIMGDMDGDIPPFLAALMGGGTPGSSPRRPRNVDAGGSENGLPTKSIIDGILGKSVPSELSCPPAPPTSEVDPFKPSEDTPSEG